MQGETTGESMPGMTMSGETMSGGTPPIKTPLVETPPVETLITPATPEETPTPMPGEINGHGSFAYLYTIHLHKILNAIGLGPVANIVPGLYGREVPGTRRRVM